MRKESKMHSYSVLSVLFVPIHIHFKRLHFKNHPALSWSLLQLDSNIVSVIKGNPKHTLKTIPNVEFCKSSCNKYQTAFWGKKKGTLQIQQMSFASATLFFFPLELYQKTSKELNSLPEVILS